MPPLPILPSPPGLPGLIQPGLPGPQPDGSPAAEGTSAASFVDQLTAALALLSPPQPASTSPAELMLPEDAAASDSDTEPAPAAPENKDTQPGAQEMADLLASFGLVPLPIVTPPPASPPVPHATQAATQGDEPAATAPLPVQPPTLSAPPAQARPVLDAAVVDSPVPADTAVSGAPVTVTPPASSADATQTTDTATPSAVRPTRGGSRRVEPRPEREARAVSSTQAASEVRAARVLDTVHPRLTAVWSAPVEAPAGPSQHGSQPERQGPEPPAPAADADTNDPPTSATPTATGPAAPAATTGPAPAEAPRPGAVVAQIAHQAELYRLPGGRGVRIQLHPEGLGGVEVTVRYGPAGALELHVTVEHAATGALVQAGWTELREALSQQGISPDRLVMSLSGPHGGSLSSDGGSSGSGSSFRSDAGPTGFGQSASHGQQDREQAPARARWNSTMEPPNSQEPEAVAPVSSSRIDLRA